jgi:hypothetical protein
VRGGTVNCGLVGGAPITGKPCATSADRWLSTDPLHAAAAARACRSGSSGCRAYQPRRTRAIRPVRTARLKAGSLHPCARASARLKTGAAGSGRIASGCRNEPRRVSALWKAASSIRVVPRLVDSRRETEHKRDKRDPLRRCNGSRRRSVPTV